MPLYDYECPKCGAVREVQHPVSEIGKIDVPCEECKVQMKKKISIPALIGFDDVGRSLGKKDKEATTKPDSSKESKGSGEAKTNGDAAKQSSPASATKKDANS